MSLVWFIRSFFLYQIIGGAGHHVYADKLEEFHDLVLGVCETVDDLPSKGESTINEKTTALEDQVHEVQTGIGRTVLGTIQATEAIETP